MLSLVPVDRDNWQECIHLPTSEDQNRFVASNVYSIAEAQFYPKATACCIYDDAQMVGFAMFGPSETDPDVFCIDRLMIAEPYRGKGHGRAALQLILEEAQAQGYRAVELSTDPANAKAIHLYESVGFVATGERDGDEAVYRWAATWKSNTTRGT